MAINVAYKESEWGRERGEEGDKNQGEEGEKREGETTRERGGKGGGEDREIFHDNRNVCMFLFLINVL
jgi:hypothetical protein